MSSKPKLPGYARPGEVSPTPLPATSRTTGKSDAEKTPDEKGRKLIDDYDVEGYCRNTDEFWGERSWELLGAQFFLFLAGIVLLALAMGLCPFPQNPIDQVTQ